MGPRASLDDVENIPYWDSNSNPSVIQPVANRYTNCAIPAPILPVYYIECCIYCKLLIEIFTTVCFC
jgi:hypothetical protein